MSRFVFLWLFLLGLLAPGRVRAQSSPPRAEAYLTVRVLDSRSNQPVPAQVRVAGRNTPPFTGEVSPAQPAFRRSLAAPDLLSIEVTAAGYTPVTQVLDARRWVDTTEFRAEVRLLPGGLSKVFLQVYDADTREAIRTARFTLTDLARRTTYAVQPNPQTGEALAEVPLGRDYLVQIEAPGYQPRETDLRQPTDGTVSRLGLRRARLVTATTLVLTATERGTGRALPAQFRVTNLQTKEVFTEQTTADKALIRRPLGAPGVLQIEVTSEGFLPLTQTRDLRQPGTSTSVTIQAELSPAAANWTLTAVDATTRQPLPQARFTVRSLEDGREVPPQPNTAAGNWTAQVPTGRRYTVRVDAPQHEPIEQTLTVESTAATKLIELVPIVYRLRLRATNDRTGEGVEGASIALFDAKTRRPISLRMEGDGVVAELPQLSELVVEADAPGFKKLREAIKVSEWFGRYEFRRDVPLFALPSVGVPRAGTNPVGRQAPTARSTVAAVPVTPEPSRFDNLRKGQTVVLNNIYFDQSSYTLRPESGAELDRLVAALRANPNLKIVIAGHTDNVGDARLNNLLSENRAKVVRNYLFNRGIADARLSAVGYGPSRPVAPNDTEEARSRNRRVEFTVLED
jgi:outer membrane protein OmpA-like peptidoglycan-associated protein